MTASNAPDVVRSAYAQLAVTDLGAARWFWVDMLGFHIQYEDAGSLYLRGTDELTHHSLVLRKGDLAALDHISYRVRTPEDVDKAEKFFAGLGCPVKRLKKGEGTHGIGDAVRVIDPLGFPVEFFHEIERAERLIQRYDIRHGAEIARLDHFNICTPDIPAAYAHYKSLGFGCSETIEGDEHELYAAWMYRKQTVHDVAFTGVPDRACTTSGWPPTSPTRYCARPTSSARCTRSTTSSVAPAGTVSPTPSTSTCGTPTATAWRSTPRTTTPVTRTTRRTVGTCATTAAATSGATPSSSPGTRRPSPSSTWTDVRGP